MKLQIYCTASYILLALTLATAATGNISTNMVGNSSACRQPKAPGLCRGKLLRYAYNEETNNCISFIYTGCGPSTKNNFHTFEECRRDCMQKLRY